MRRWLICIALAAAATSCIPFRTVRHNERRPTGTCPGACTHYVECKKMSTESPTFHACVQECRDIYEDPQMLASFERLTCDDAVAFVEGDSGREPGQPQSHRDRR